MLFCWSAKNQLEHRKISVPRSILMLFSNDSCGSLLWESFSQPLIERATLCQGKAMAPTRLDRYEKIALLLAVFLGQSTIGGTLLRAPGISGPDTPRMFFLRKGIVCMWYVGLDWADTSRTFPAIRLQTPDTLAPTLIHAGSRYLTRIVVVVLGADPAPSRHNTTGCNFIVLHVTREYGHWSLPRYNTRSTRFSGSTKATLTPTD